MEGWKTTFHWEGNFLGAMLVLGSVYRKWSYFAHVLSRICTTQMLIFERDVCVCVCARERVLLSGFLWNSLPKVTPMFLSSYLRCWISWMNGIPLHEASWDKNQKVALSSRIHVLWVCKLGDIQKGNLEALCYTQIMHWSYNVQSNQIHVLLFHVCWSTHTKQVQEPAICRGNPYYHHQN